MRGPFEQILNTMGFTLSLPERFLRSLAAALGGTSKLLADLLLPEPLRKSSTYAALVGNAQRFLIEQVAQVPGVYKTEDGAALPDDFVARKIAGNLMEAAGVFSVHLSPLWVFAAAADVAAGSKVYLDRLVGELKKRGVVSGDGSFNGLNELLESLARSSKDSASVFDAPPVDLAQLAQLRDQLAEGYKAVFKDAGRLLPRIDGLWAKMESVAARDGMELGSVVGLMTVDLAGAAGKALDTAFSVGHVTTGLLAETILQSYGETIDRVQKVGVLASIENASQPFLSAIAGHIDGGRQTWTERAWRRLVGPGVGEQPATGPAEAPTSDAAAGQPPEAGPKDAE